MRNALRMQLKQIAIHLNTHKTIKNHKNHENNDDNDKDNNTNSTAKSYIKINCILFARTPMFIIILLKFANCEIFK